MALFLSISILLTVVAFFSIVMTSDKPFPPDNNEPENLHDTEQLENELLDEEEDTEFIPDGIVSRRLELISA